MNRMNSLIYNLLWLIRFVLDWISSIVYGLIYETDRNFKIPPISSPNDEAILLKPAVDLVREIKAGRLTSRKIVETYIARIKEVNGVINCFVDTRFEEALKEASEVDTLIENSKDKQCLFIEKPLLGVPVSIKECFQVSGMRLTIGLVSRTDKKSTTDAVAVANIKKAGAIVLGVTNVSELCMWMETSNNVYGRTKNPYHPGRIVGGSSGGEVAAIASTASVIGIGSDVGGSIRMPAFFCGIFGHKPSTGEPVSNDGQLPMGVGAVRDFLSTGPLTRYARDLMPMYKAMIGDQEIIQNRLNLDKPVDIKKLRIFFAEDDGGFPFITPVHNELRLAQRKLLSELQSRFGLTSQKVRYDEFFNSFFIWSHKMGSEPRAPKFAALLNDLEEPPINPWIELVKWLCYKSSKHTLPAIGLAIFEKTVRPGRPEHAEYLAMCDVLRQKLEELLGNDGILVYPSHPTPAPYHGEPILKTMNFSYTAIFNVLGFPVTQVPLGLSSEFGGVPIGIQLVSARNQDRLPLALALEVENIFGGWQKPTMAF